MQKLKLTGRNLELTDPIKKYLTTKINKHEKLLQEALLIEVEIINNSAQTGVDNNFKLEINVNLPKAFIKVEDSGSDVYALVDKLERVLFRRLKRYHDLYRKWQGRKKWKLAKTATKIDAEALDSYEDYEPFVAKRKTYEDDSPKHPAEAIEAMELLGYNSFLFRNIESDKYSMVYKRKNGGYGLVEPPH